LDGGFFSAHAVAGHKGINSLVAVVGILHVVETGGVETFHHVGCFGIGKNGVGGIAEPERPPVPYDIHGVNDDFAARFAQRLGNPCSCSGRRGDEDDVGSIHGFLNVLHGGIGVGEQGNAFKTLSVLNAQKNVVSSFRPLRSQGATDVARADNCDIHVDVSFEVINFVRPRMVATFL